MSFYPLLNLNDFESFVTLYNFSPNDHENFAEVYRVVYAHWSTDSVWHHLPIQPLNAFETFTLRYSDLSFYQLNVDSTIFLSLEEFSLPASSSSLNSSGQPRSLLPEWRSTIGFMLPNGSVISYQGEIHPFAAQSTCLSFSHLDSFNSLDYNKYYNYLLFVNLTASASTRKGKLCFFDINTKKCIYEHVVATNTCNVIDLKNLKLTGETNYFFYSSEMSGIPIYFSCSSDFSSHSLEHTHPPASLSILGNRWANQSALKDLWLSYINK
jgi:hypothetical protein